MVVSRVNLYNLEFFHRVIHMLRENNLESAEFLRAAHCCNELTMLFSKCWESNFKTSQNAKSLHSCIETCLIKSFYGIKLLKLSRNVWPKLIWNLRGLLRHHVFIWINLSRHIVWIQAWHHILCRSTSLS